MLLLIVGVLIGCSDIFIPHLIMLFINAISKETSIEKQLRSDIIETKRQMQAVNMVDQFPVYAKLQRKINSLSSQYKEKSNERKLGMQKMRLILSILLKGLVFIFCLWIAWNYRSNPVVTLPVELLWPVATILALPYCQPGEISIIIWLGLVKAACSRFDKIIKKK